MSECGCCEEYVVKIEISDTDNGFYLCQECFDTFIKIDLLLPLKDELTNLIEEE